MYERLFVRQGSGDVLHFDSIAEIATSKDGTMNRPKLKALIRMFRPARDGKLTMLDFLKSVDSVYKEFRVLQASIENAGTVGKAFELMVNWYVHENVPFRHSIYLDSDIRFTLLQDILCHPLGYYSLDHWLGPARYVSKYQLFHYWFRFHDRKCFFKIL